MLAGATRDGHDEAHAEAQSSELQTRSPPHLGDTIALSPIRICLNQPGPSRRVRPHRGTPAPSRSSTAYQSARSPPVSRDTATALSRSSTAYQSARSPPVSRDTATALSRSSTACQSARSPPVSRGTATALSRSSTACQSARSPPVSRGTATALSRSSTVCQSARSQTRSSDQQISRCTHGRAPRSGWGTATGSSPQRADLERIRIHNPTRGDVAYCKGAATPDAPTPSSRRLPHENKPYTHICAGSAIAESAGV